MLVTSQLKSMMEFMIVKPVQCGGWLRSCRKLDAFNSARFVRFALHGLLLFLVKSQVHTRSRVKYTHGE